MSTAYERLFLRAREEAARAVSLDGAGRHKEAAEHYLEAARLLMELIRRTKDGILRKQLAEKAEIYVKRAERIRRGVVRPAEAGPERPTEAIGEIVEALPPELQGAVLVEKPDVGWDDIGGLKEAKRALKEAIVWPMLRPELFKGPREPWRGILLFGPPGCGKTLLAKAVASQCKATFFNVDAAVVMSKWLGESEKNVKALFDAARKAAPSVIFVDEVDSLLTTRGLDEVGGERRVKTQFLIELDGLRSLEELVVVIGATNRPWDLDPAIIRRFERRVYVPLPDEEARKEIFEIHLRGVELAEDVDLSELARLTIGYTGSDIKMVCREAAMEPLRELMEKEEVPEGDLSVRPICKADFVKALRAVKPVVKPTEVRRYMEWAEQYGEF
ncbi:MAG TPA: ATP-binding protein [Candidatus Bathyarchaeota archaeon]|mgnify:CR=1 FL=1|nr:MAG: AAA family ATPase [Candidatus Bathyarchaeota archaeon]HDJ26389.1 ATP-binding protein [Candidatus Bathyarchaeota archaeon]